MNVPKLRFKEFNDEWSTESLSKVVTFSKGNTLSKSDLDESGPYPCILYGELYTKYNEVIRKIYSKTNRNENNIPKSKKGDILMPSSGETPIDISTSSCIQIDNVLLGGDINILRPISCDGRFLSYLINNNKKTEIAKVAQGHSVVHLYNDNLKQVSINIPSIQEQKKISDMLELLDKKIELQTKKIEALKLFKKGLFDTQLKTNEKESIMFDDFLDEVTEKSSIQNQYPVLSSTSKGLFLQSDYFNKQASSENNVGYKILKRNQLVLSPQNLWMGNININNIFDIGIVSPSYRVYNIDIKKMDLNYFNYWIKTPKALYSYLISSEQGASIVRRNLNIEMFNQISLKVPKLEKQYIIGNKIYQFNLKINFEEEKLEQFHKLKKALLQNMFV